MRYVLATVFCLFIGCGNDDQINKQSYLLCALNKRLSVLEDKSKVKAEAKDIFTCNGYEKPLK